MYFIVTFAHTDAIIEFVNETFYTEETGILSVELFVNTTGIFQTALFVELQIVDSPVAGELFCHSHTVMDVT